MAVTAGSDGTNSRTENGTQDGEASSTIAFGRLFPCHNSVSPFFETLANNHAHHCRDSLPTVVTVAPHELSNGNHEPISPISGPGPKVMVRKPTNLSDRFDVQGSDADSASASSRSPSPHPPRLEPNKFVLVPTKGLSEVLGCDRDRRTRSPSPDRRPNSRNGGASGTQSPPSELYLFQIKQVGQLQYKNIPMDHVHELTYMEKQWMLGVEPDADMDPDALLESISRLDQKVASLFMVKPDIKASFNFRLVYSHREVVKHSTVESAVLCDIDEAVIRLSKKYLPGMSIGFQHPNVSVHIGDGFQFLKERKEEFDIIITDSSDPEGPAESLFQKPYFELLYGALRDGGVITTQGCSFSFLSVAVVVFPPL